MDRALTFILVVMAPGAVLIFAAMLLIILGSVRGDAPSVSSMRLFYLGFALLNLVPGVAIIAAVLLGWLMWPAAIGGLVPTLIGIGVLYGLRLRWADPASG